MPKIQVLGVRKAALTADFRLRVLSSSERELLLAVLQVAGLIIWNLTKGETSRHFTVLQSWFIVAIKD